MLNTRIFDELEDFRRSFDRLFENVSWPVQRTKGEGEWYFAPAVESGWTDDFLNLRVVLPAVSEKDLEVSVQGNQLTVRGERKSPEGFGREGQIHQRLPYGKFERTIDLPNGLNAEKLQAHLHDGVLDIRVPVAEAMKPRKISITPTTDTKAIAA